MLMHLKSEPDDLTALPSEVIESLVSELVRASLVGYHLIVIPRAICTWAMQNLSLNAREKAHLDHLRSQFAQFGALLREAPCYLEITVGNEPLSELEDHKYHIGHRRLLETKLLEEARLLIENITYDGDILDVIFNTLRKSHPVKNFNYLKLHGGGADIVNCFRMEVTERRVLVSIVDSDRASPFSRKSDTSRRIFSEARKQTFVGGVFETISMESENYIPFELLHSHRHEICPEYCEFEKLREIVDRQGQVHPGDCVWLFFDLKNGWTVERLSALSNCDEQAWLENKLLVDGQALSEFAISGFGETTLRRVLNCGAAMKDFVAFQGSEYWKTHFAEFFELIAWYFSSHPRQAVS